MNVAITVHWNDGDETINFDNEDDAKGFVDSLSKVGSVPYTWIKDGEQDG